MKTKTTIKQNVSRLNELEKLAKEIKSTFASANDNIKSSQTRSFEAAKDATLCAMKLRRAKELVGHGGFVKWMKTALKWSDSDITQGYRWMSKLKINNVLKYSATSNRMKEVYSVLGVEVPEIVADDGDDDETSTSQAPTQAPAKALPAPVATSKATLSAKLNITQVHSSITKADVLSRTKYLAKELLLDIQSKLQTNAVTLDDLEGVALKPLAEWFAGQRKATAGGRK